MLFLDWISGRLSSPHPPPLAPRYQPFLILRQTFIASQNRHRSGAAAAGNPRITAYYSFSRWISVATPSRSWIPHRRAIPVATPARSSTPDTCSHAFRIIDASAAVRILRNRRFATTSVPPRHVPPSTAPDHAPSPSARSALPPTGVSATTSSLISHEDDTDTFFTDIVLYAPRSEARRRA